MKKIIIPLFSILCLATAAKAADNFTVNTISADEIKASIKVINTVIPAPKPAALTAAQNNQLYNSGAVRRAKISREALRYVNAEEARTAPKNAFLSPTPAGVANPAEYAALREKNAGFIRNIGYWQEQVRSNYPNLRGALRVNDLATANILLNYMRHDHFAVTGEIAAIQENNRKAAAWPMKETNEQLYNAGAVERASILAQAAAAADLTGRDKPRNAFEEPTPAGTANVARYEELRGKNAAFINNIEYWRNQLEGNYGNLKDAVRVNDLETARILLNYLKKDSADLDNEIKAVERNNAEAAGL